jgi:hypothetical protein
VSPNSQFEIQISKDAGTTQPPGFAGLLCPQDRYGIIMHRTERPDDHERFKELCALAQANSLGMVDQLELKEHLKICDSCRKIYDQYAAIGSEGMAFLAGCNAVSEEAERWDNGEVWQKLFVGCGCPRSGFSDLGNQEPQSHSDRA